MMHTTDEYTPWITLLYTCFMLVFVPVYWYFYGAVNFLYFCDISLILTYIGIMTENKLFISMSSVGIMIPQTLWIADFIGTACGKPLIHMTDYMFREDHLLLLRSLS